MSVRLHGYIMRLTTKVAFPLGDLKFDFKVALRELYKNVDGQRGVTSA